MNHELAWVTHMEDGVVYVHKSDCPACAAGDNDLKVSPVIYDGVPEFRLMDDAGINGVTEAAEWIAGQMEHGELVQMAWFKDGNPDYPRRNGREAE